MGGTAGVEPEQPESSKPLKRRKSGPRRVRVTPFEREVFALRTSKDPPMTWAAIGRQLAKEPQSVRTAYIRAARKLPREGELEPESKSLQVSDPDKYAKLVNELSEYGPDGEQLAVDAIAKRLNLPRATAQQLAVEIRSIYFPTKVEARNIKLERLRDLWGMRAEEALAQLTPERIANASPKDLAIIAGISTEKLLLLRGQPTQIIRTEKDRLKVETLAQAFMKEAERRGYSLSPNVESGTVDVEYTGFGNVPTKKQEAQWEQEEG
jgi:hypothetical protein